MPSFSVNDALFLYPSFVWISFPSMSFSVAIEILPIEQPKLYSYFLSLLESFPSPKICSLERFFWLHFFLKETFISFCSDFLLFNFLCRKNIVRIKNTWEVKSLFHCFTMKNKAYHKCTTENCFLITFNKPKDLGLCWNQEYFFFNVVQTLAAFCFLVTVLKASQLYS